PSVFGQGSELRTAQGFIYRYFASSGVYVGIKDGDVYVRGAQWGSTITRKGSVIQITGLLESIRDERGVSVGEGLEGDYTLTITGSYKTSFLNIEIPQIVMPDMPAPQPGDTDAIVDAFGSAQNS